MKWSQAEAFARPTTSDRGAIVIGSDVRGLVVVRSLGRRRIPVLLLVDEQLIAAVSRYALCKMPWPSDSTEAQQAEYLLDLANRHNLKGWALIPTTDEHAALLARYHNELISAFRIVTSPWKALRWAYDKRLSYQLAGEIGVAHPRTWYPKDRQEVTALGCEYPVILKPAFKAARNRFTQDKAWKVNNPNELLRRYEEATAMLDSSLVMVQELIPGGGECQYSYGALWADGQPLVSVVAQRRRQYPVEFGRSSSYVETILNQKIEDDAQRLLSALDYSGLVEVEFKYDQRDGRYKVLDLNPRIWGWGSLPAAAGVDLPYLFWQLCQGGFVPQVKGVPGVRWIRMTSDLLAAFTEMSRARLGPLAYLRSFRAPFEFAVFVLDDPVPSLLEVPLLSIAKCKGWLKARANATGVRQQGVPVYPLKAAGIFLQRMLGSLASWSK